MIPARSFQLLGLPLVLSACADLVDVVEDPSGAFVITPTQSVYRWDGVSQSLVIEATVVNSGTRRFFARIGDAFSPTVDQQTLYVANGSDGYLEQRTPAGWIPTDRATLIEGVSTVPLEPNTTYTLVAFVDDHSLRGMFRLRIEYATDEQGTWAGESWSAPFELR